jgi:hypothetical protein
MPHLETSGTALPDPRNGPAPRERTVPRFPESSRDARCIQGIDHTGAKLPVSRDGEKTEITRPETGITGLLRAPSKKGNFVFVILII